MLLWLGWLGCGSPPHVCWEEQVRSQPWPVPLPALPLPDAPDDWERIGQALAKAGAWLAEAGREGELRYDAAIGVSEVTRIVTDPSWALAKEQALTRAARDADNPARRLFEPDFRVAPGKTTSWTAPAPGRRIPYNAVVAEALHCPEHGWRPQSEAYACGAMRDGGYGTTHALWALQIARGAGCTPAPCLPELHRELVALLSAPWPDPLPLQALDLRAEAAVMLLRDGQPVGDTLEQLMSLQGQDGSWGSEGDREALRYHATLLASWALALGLERRVGR